MEVGAWIIWKRSKYVFDTIPIVPIPSPVGADLSVADNPASVYFLKGNLWSLLIQGT